MGYYGYQDSVTNFTERDDKGAGFLADVVEQWENEACKFGGRTVLLRFSVILSKRGGVVGKLIPLFNLAAGGNFGSGKQAFSWVTEADAVAAILLTLENQKASGAINVCSPNPETNEVKNIVILISILSASSSYSNHNHMITKFTLSDLHSGSWPSTLSTSCITSTRVHRETCFRAIWRRNYSWWTTMCSRETSKAWIHILRYQYL